MILVVLFILSVLIALGLAWPKIAKGYELGESGTTVRDRWLMAEYPVVVPTSTPTPRPTPVLNEIESYIMEVFGTDGARAIKIAKCESGLNVNAFNPETKAKEKGITKFSSCGIFQNNDPRCDDRGSVLYDYKYNTQEAYRKFKARGFEGPWVTCSK